MLDGMMGFPVARGMWEWRIIFGWLLILFVHLLLAGRLAEWERMHGIYTRLMRYHSWKKWWRQLCIREILLTIAYMVLAGGASLLLCGDWSVGQRLTAVGLMTVQLCMNSLLSAWLLLRTGNPRWSAGVMMMYYLLVLVVPGDFVCWYPVSWSMWERSSLSMGQGFSVELVLAVQIVIILIICFLGWTNQCRNVQMERRN